MSNRTTNKINIVQANFSVPPMVSQKTEEKLNQTRLEELQELTGCPITLVIEGRCQTEGCPNAERWLTRSEQEKTEYCRRVQKIARVEFAPPPEPHQTETGQTLSAPQPPAPIFDPQPRMRCIL